ncbi:MAG: DegT/DnrJ/EryC1/StrS family aminotransferase, partial [Muribaculaceae bacterium]|nr:DegT/DnrJ/EryC1/StrS family aminotransferase [Muribaculaceae bacterium]
MDRIYLCLAHMSGKEQDFIKEAFDTNWVVPMGPNVNAFEHDLENFVNEVKGDEKNNSQFSIYNSQLDKKVVCLSAGTAAVHLALLACGVEAGDEVLVQSFTFCASSHPIT